MSYVYTQDSICSASFSALGPSLQALIFKNASLSHAHVDSRLGLQGVSSIAKANNLTSHRICLKDSSPPVRPVSPAFNAAAAARVSAPHKSGGQSNAGNGGACSPEAKWVQLIATMIAALAAQPFLPRTKKVPLLVARSPLPT